MRIRATVFQVSRLEPYAANRRDFDDPRIAVFQRESWVPGDPVQAAWQVAHVHLCKTSVSALISCPLLLAVALRILRASVAVVTPVFLISLRPRLLRGTLVDPVVGIGLKLGPLPLALACALAIGRGAVSLIRNLWARLEWLATAGADLVGHQRSPYENSYGNG